MQEGIYKMQKNKWFDAEICFEKILKKESLNIPTASQLAICYEVTGSKKKLKTFVENTVNLFASKGNLNSVAEILKSCYNVLDANFLTEFLQKYGDSVIDLVNTPLLRLISENNSIQDKLKSRAIELLKNKQKRSLE